MMRKKVKVSNIVIGEGTAKKCVPVFGSSTRDVMAHLNDVLSTEPDIIEFRADYLDAVFDCRNVIDVLRSIRESTGETPLLFTFRTTAHGGEKNLPEEEYISLLKSVIRNRLADIIDVEYPVSPIDIIPADYPFIYSYHATKDAGLSQIGIDINKLTNAAKSGTAILKIAIPICSEEELIKLKELSDILSEVTDAPLIIIGVGENGKDTRLHPEKYNSSVTFMKRGKGTASGQIDILTT